MSQEFSDLEREILEEDIDEGILDEIGEKIMGSEKRGRGLRTRIVNFLREYDPYNKGTNHDLLKFHAYKLKGKGKYKFYYYINENTKTTTRTIIEQYFHQKGLGDVLERILEEYG